MLCYSDISCIFAPIIIENYSMKKNLLTFLFSVLLFTSCLPDNAVSPVIDVKSCMVNGKNIIGCPAVKAGDQLELQLELKGNGSDLKTFQAKANKQAMNLELADYEKQNVSKDKNFTDVSACKISFVDGVMHSTVKVKAVVQSAQSDTLKLNFYLSAKADCEGTSLELDMQKAK